MPDITVVGSFVMDMVASIDEFPKEGQTIIGKRIRIYPGGKGANQCVACARLGGSTEMIGMVGDDANGRVFTDLFKSEGIKCDNIFVTGEEPTAIAQVQINARAENKIVVIPSANHIFGLDELNAVRGIIAKTKLVVMQLELRYDVTLALIKMCHELSVPVILNPAPAVPLDNSILAMVDYLTPNETELEILSGMPCDTTENILKAAKSLLSAGVKNIIATLGSKGALLANKDGLRIIEGYKVKVVDTVAAGDSFNGALAKCIAEKTPLDEAVKFANAVGALTVSKPGAIPSLPYLKNVQDFISQGPSA